MRHARPAGRSFMRFCFDCDVGRARKHAFGASAGPDSTTDEPLISHQVKKKAQQSVSSSSETVPDQLSLSRREERRGWFRTVGVTSSFQCHLKI
jgi:hypothetical protein